MVKRALQRGVPGEAAATTGLVAGGTALVALTYGVVRFGYGLHLPVVAAELDLAPTLQGAVATGAFGAYCVVALLAGGLVRRAGGRPVLRLSAALAAVGALVVAVAPSAPVLAVGVLVAGGAAGAASPALVVAVAGTVPAARAARAQAVVNGGTGLGVAVAGVGVLVAPTQWRPVWAGAAVAVVLVAVVVDRRTRWPAPSAAQPPDGRARRDLLRPLAAAGLAGAGSAAVWTFGRGLLGEVGGLPGRTTAALWVLLGAAAVLGALSGDAVRLMGLRRAWLLTVAGSAAGAAVLALAPSSVLLAGAAGALFGASYTALSGVLIAWAGALRPATAGATTATLFVGLTAGQAVGATAAGRLAEEVGLAGAVLAGAAVLLAAVLPSPGRAPRRPRQPRRAGKPPVATGLHRVGVMRTSALPWRAMASRYSSQSGCSPEMERK